MGQLSLLDRLIRACGGYDIFISYSHADGDEYARNLFRRLRLKYSCRFDQQGNDPGEQVSALLLADIRRSRALVVLSTLRALNSKPIEDELRELEKPAEASSRSPWTQILRGPAGPD